MMVRGTALPWVDGERLLSYFAGVGGDPWARYHRLVETELQQ